MLSARVHVLAARGDLKLDKSSKAASKKQKRLLVPFYQLSNGGITASLFFQRVFIFARVPVLTSGPFNLI